MRPSEALTIFACPKPFAGQMAVIQRNAITSWTLLEPRPQIILFGDEQGTRELCGELGLRHMPGVQMHKRGVPVLNALIDQAQTYAVGGRLCFINADIILMRDFSEAVDEVARHKRRHLLIGQRRDLDVTAPLRFSDPAWQDSLRAAAMEKGRLHGEFGIDYFVFTPGLFDPVPPLLIGRAAIDNWLVYRARSRWVPVVDATAAVMAVHQNHDYSHHPSGRSGVFEGEDAQINWNLAGGHDHRFWITDRTHVLTPNGLRLDLSMAQLQQHWRRLPVLVPPSLRRPMQLLQKGVRACRRLRLLAQP